MMSSDEYTIRSLYEAELYKYINLAEELSDLEDLGPYAGNIDDIKDALSRSREKLKIIASLSKSKLGIDFGTIPPYVKFGGNA